MTPQGEGIPDWAKTFVEFCIAMSRRNNEDVVRGHIPMGGMVTTIADSLYFKYNDLQPATGENLFDLKIGTD